MKKLIYASIVALVSTGCVWTRETTEVIVHKNPEGKVIGVDYTERREQQDIKPWAKFGGFIEEYGSSKSTK